MKNQQKNQLEALCSTETLFILPKCLACCCLCVCAKCVMSTLQNTLKVLLCSLESCVSCSFHFNAGSGNLQHSPTGSSGQAAIERPQGITVLLQLSSQIIGLLWRGHCPHIQLIWDLELVFYSLLDCMSTIIKYEPLFTVTHSALKVVINPVCVKIMISEHYHN